MQETPGLEFASGERSAVWWLVSLVFVIAIAAFLRFYGLKWGLPNLAREYSYHPDEFLTIGTAFGRIIVHRTFDPGFYNYPTLYIYLVSLSILTGFAYGAAGTLANVYLAARSVTAVMGTAAVATTYWAGKVCFGRAAGLIAALIVCIAPLHVQHSHFATVDVPSTMFVAAALGFSGLIRRRGEWRDYVLGGVMCGFAAGTKYNAGLVLLSVVAAHFLRAGLRLRSLCSGKLWAAIGCAIVAFVVSTPGSVLQTSSFLHSLVYEMRHAASGHGLVFAGTGSGFAYTFTSSLWYGLGPILILFVPAVLLTLIRREKAALCVLAFVVPYYILISLSQVRFARYALPMFPGIAILAGWFVVETWRSFERRGRWAWALVVGALACWALCAAIAWAALFGLRDPRDQAAQWIRKHIPKGASIGVIEVPWFYSPPLSKRFGFGTLDTRREAMQRTPWKLTGISNEPSWSVVSDFETHDALRLCGNRTLAPDHRADVVRILSDLNLVKTHYLRRQIFGGLSGALRTLGFPDPPHDMRYVRPEITIYERKK